jgi:pimeloyl-ACP methyl ester carboxylesterase
MFEAIAKELELYGGHDPPPDYTLNHEIDGLLRTADEAGFDRFHLVGYSAGGATSLAFASRYPRRLLSLALLEPAWMGNEDLAPQERALRREFDRLDALPPAEMMAAFVAIQLAPGVTPPPPPPGAPPPWMASRPAGLRALMTAFGSSTLDLDSLRTFMQPVYFALGGRSNPDYYARIAGRAAAIFRRLHARGLRAAPSFRPATSGRARTHCPSPAASVGASRRLTEDGSAAKPAEIGQPPAGGHASAAARRVAAASRAWGKA